MIIKLTPEEVLEDQRENFRAIEEGSLCSFCDYRREKPRLSWFIVIKKMKKELEVIELMGDNRKKIMAGQRCDTVRLHFEDLCNLQLESK